MLNVPKESDIGLSTTWTIGLPSEDWCGSRKGDRSLHEQAVALLSTEAIHDAQRAANHARSEAEIAKRENSDLRRQIAQANANASAAVNTSRALTELMIKVLTKLEAQTRTAPSLLETVLGPLDEVSEGLSPLSAHHLAALASSDDD